MVGLLCRMGEEQEEAGVKGFGSGELDGLEGLKAA